MLESQKRKGGLVDGEKSPSSAKKPKQSKNLTSLLPFGKKKNAADTQQLDTTQIIGQGGFPISISAKDSGQSV